MAATLKIPTVFYAIDKVSSVVDGMSGKVSSGIQKMNKVATKGAVSASFVLGSLTVAANDAIQFEDKMSDVAKTTGLAGKELTDYGNKLRDVSTKSRSSIDDLIAIGVVGGQLGIAKEQLADFTESANKFAVALGGDYSGGVEQAITQVGKINGLFKDTKNLDPSESIMRTGSAINDLTIIGTKAENLNDFVLRMGALPDAMKPSYTATVALGAALELAGVDAQIASSGLSNLIIKAGDSLPLVAKQMKMTHAEAKNLFNTDTAAFALRLAKSFDGMSNDKLIAKLKELGMNSNEVQKVIGALGAQHDNLVKSFKGGPSIMERSADAFAKMTSVTEEWQVKEDTTAAKLERTQNQLKELSITIGMELLPEIAKLTPTITEALREFTKFVKENEWLLPTLIKIVAALYAFKILMVAMPAIMAAYNVALGIATALQGKSAFYVAANTVAYKAYRATVVATTAIMKAYTTAQWAINAAMYANPVGLIVLAIIALIALLALGIYYWDEWGAALLQMIGPLGWLINLIMTFRKYWDLIVEAFEKDGIIGGLNKIHQVFVKALLIPARQVLELLSGIPGMSKLAARALEGFDKLEMRLGTNMLDTERENLHARQNLQVGQGVLAPEAAKEKKGKVEIELKPPANWGIETKSGGDFNMPIKLNNTFAPG